MELKYEIWKIFVFWNYLKKCCPTSMDDSTVIYSTVDLAFLQYYNNYLRFLGQGLWNSIINNSHDMLCCVKQLSSVTVRRMRFEVSVQLMHIWHKPLIKSSDISILNLSQLHFDQIWMKENLIKRIVSNIICFRRVYLYLNDLLLVQTFVNQENSVSLKIP